MFSRVRVCSSDDARPRTLPSTSFSRSGCSTCSPISAFRALMFSAQCRRSQSRAESLRSMASIFFASHPDGSGMLPDWRGRGSSFLYWLLKGEYLHREGSVALFLGEEEFPPLHVLSGKLITGKFFPVARRLPIVPMLSGWGHQNGGKHFGFHALCPESRSVSADFFVRTHNSNHFYCRVQRFNIINNPAVRTFPAGGEHGVKRRVRAAVSVLSIAIVDEGDGTSVRPLVVKEAHFELPPKRLKLARRSGMVECVEKVVAVNHNFPVAMIHGARGQGESWIGQAAGCSGDGVAKFTNAHLI